MPYDIEWLLKGRIIHMRDYGDCKVEELDDAITRLHKLLDQGSAPVHIIHDNRDVTKYLLSIQTLKPIVKKHANTG